MDGDTTTTHLLIFDTKSKQWMREDKVVSYLDNWNLYSGFTWNDLINYITGTGEATAEWSDLGTKTWANFSSSQARLMMNFYGFTHGNMVFFGRDRQLRH